MTAGSTRAVLFGMRKAKVTTFVVTFVLLNEFVAH
jgi:hypothetical protein